MQTGRKTTISVNNHNLKVVNKFKRGTQIKIFNWFLTELGKIFDLLDCDSISILHYMKIGKIKLVVDEEVSK